MKIKLGRRNSGLTLLEGLFFLALFLVFLGGIFYFMIRACASIAHAHNTQNGETNNLAYTGPGLVVWQQTNITAIPTNMLIAEEILFTDNLLSPWQPCTNIILQPDQVYDWTQLIDKTSHCGFFKITIYGTNQ